MTGKPSCSQADTSTVTVKAKETNGPLFDTENFTLKVSESCHPPTAPVLDSITNKTINENTSFSYAANATDVNGDAISYSLTVSPSWLTIDSSSGLMTGKPSCSQASSSTVTVKAEETNGSLFDTESFTLKVNESCSTNKAPVANAGGDLNKLERQWVTLNGSGTDDDGTISSYSWTQTGGAAVSDWTVIDNDSVKFISPHISENSTLTFTLQVIDNNGADDTDEVKVNLNDRPSVASILVPSANYKYRSDENINLSITGIADSSDNIVEAQTYIRTNDSGSWQIIHGWKTMTLNAAKTGATYGWGGASPLGLLPNIKYQMIARAIDDGLSGGHGWHKGQYFYVNDKPVINAQSSIIIEKNTSRAITLSDITISDSDDASHTFTVLSGSNYTVSGNTITPTVDFSGQLNVNIKVNDGIEDSDVYSLNITVNDIDETPTRKTIFIHTDILGTPVAETDSNGDVQ
jgi:hypothetical protein